ncbi:MAG TPA: DUF4932 domain-containing protein, partial [Kofleriaceae bacterium]|nr:DUF4932 domain-containing protein [Kofleriaceae bacterium]
PYVNPLLAKHAVALEPAGTALWPLFAQTMRAQTYANWQTMLNEATVRALTVLYIRTHVGDDMGAAAARDEQRAGFPYISELVEVIRAYQREPGDPDALAAQLVGFFSELANRYDGQPPKTPFIGPFDAVLRGDYVLALAPGPLAARVRKLPFFAKVPVVDPDDDVPPGKGIVAYGTPTTNALIAQVAKWASWTIADDGISLGTKRFDGEHLVLIACWFRLQDPTRGVAVYAAADESDLDGINTIKHGPRDWLVARRTARGFEVVATGDWPFGTSTWEPFR